MQVRYEASRALTRERTLFLVPLMIALLAFCASGQIINQQSMSDATKDQVRPVIRLLKAALKPCLKKKLSTLFGSGFGQAQYETLFGGRAATLEDAVDHLMTMLNNDSLRLENMDARGATYLAEGLDADVVTFDDNYITRIMNGTVGHSKMFWKIALGATLANEMTHVFQKVASGDAERCDGERDSDAASIKFLCAILDALSDGSGGPNPSIAAIDVDDQAIAGFADDLTNCGINSAAEIANLHRNVKARKNSYVQRKADIFDANIAASTSWGRAYYGASYNGNHDKYVFKDPMRTSAALESDDGTSNASFSPPGGEMISQAAALLPPDDQLVLIEATHASGQNHLRFWKDADADGLPEPAEAAPAITLPPSFDPGLDGVTILPVFPAAFGTSGQNDGLMIHNHATGEVIMIELQSDGLPFPAASPLVVFQDPLLTEANGFIYFNSVIEPNPGDLSFVFSSEPNVAQFGHVPSVAITVVGVDPLTGGTPQPPVLDTLAANLAAAPVPPGAARLFEGIGSVDLVGDPGTMLSLSRMTPPTPLTVASGNTAPPGVAPFLFLAAPIEAGNLYQANDGQSGRNYFVVQGDGHDMDHVVLDDGGDPALERIDVARLVDGDVIGGRLYLGADSGGLLQPAYELVLEQAPLYIDTWGPTGRRLVVDDGLTLDLILLPGSNPPVYIQSVEDFDGDGVANESLVIRRQFGNPGFFMEVIDQVNGAPTAAVTVPLPPDAEPLSFVIDDEDADGDLDVCIRATDDVVIRMTNDGTGNFQMTTSPLHPGTGEDFEMEARVDGNVLPCPGIAIVDASQDLSLDVFSANGTFDGFRYFVVGQFFNPAFPPPGVPSFGLTFNPAGIPLPFFLADPVGSPSLLAPPLLPPGGTEFLFLVPPGLTGNSLMTQALVLTPTAGNGFFATSSGTEIRFN
ncbi:MAG TPA: hypothetical protein ENK43_14890 [Planctomycetes bacterium]|nr:hypothetical protein [Planctomycetota bacterium]